MTGIANLYPKRRRSASADAALQAEIQRMEKMTIDERIRTALSMGTQFANLQSSANKREKDSRQDE